MLVLMDLASLSSDMVAGQMPRRFRIGQHVADQRLRPDGGRHGNDSGHARNEFAGPAWCLR